MNFSSLHHVIIATALMLGTAFLEKKPIQIVIENQNCNNSITKKENIPNLDLKLKTSNSSLATFSPIASVEICDNGIDDDGDGLIDCFDPDCCSDETCFAYYYNECSLNCFFAISATTDIELEIEWESNDLGSEEWCSYNTPITGDLDGDGIPEVIGKPCPSIDVPASLPYPNLLIIDGATGMIEAMITTPAFYYVMDAPAIADVDGDGFAEIFVQASDATSNNAYAGTGPFVTGNVQRRILCYEYDGTDYVERWMSDEQIGYNDDRQAIAVSVADFNGDGIPELYCGNQILNSLTGELIAEGGESNHSGAKNQGDDPSLSQAYAVSVDVLPDDFCVNCTGLELVAGGMVYAVNIDPTNTNNNTITIEVALPGAADGWTSIADLDKDGDLDAVVSTYNTTTGLLYAWDIQTPTALYDQYLTPPSQFGYISQATISDFDGDGFVEIGVCSQFNYQVLKPVGNTFNVLWSIDTDDSSGSTGSSVFDFNNDGSDEVIYRTETELLVLEGATGSMAATFPCESGTRVEYPVVVDVDADGETELLCSCDGKLTAFGSASTPWIDTRSVWNQRNYFNVNIEDDLRVPTTQQQQHIVGDSIVLNNFLTMYGSLQSALPDASLNIDTVICNGNIFTMILTICNTGDNTLTGETPITFYNNDPTTTSPDSLFTTVLGTNLLLDSCQVLSIDINSLFETPIYAVVNDDYALFGPYDLSADFPVTSIGECDYTNNIDSFLFPDIAPPLFDLGSDTSICENSVLELNAGSGFDSYQWIDGSTDSTFIAFGSGEYWVEVTSTCGVQRDSINLIPIESVYTVLDTAVCLGDVFIINGMEIPINSTAIFSTPGDMRCLDTLEINVIWNGGVDAPVQVIDAWACENGYFTFDGVDIPPGGEEHFYYQTSLGCDSLIIVGVQSLPTYDINLQDTICQGDSILIFGEFISEAGIYNNMFTSGLNCDSMVTITLGFHPSITINFDISPTCANTNEGAIIANVTGGNGFGYSYFWSTEATTSSIEELGVGTYSLTVMDGTGCAAEGSVTVESYGSSPILESTDPDCFDSSTGSIAVTNAEMDWIFSLNDGDFQSSPSFTGLLAGEYNVTTLDEDGCSSTEVLSINAPPPIIVDFEVDSISVFINEEFQLNPIAISPSDLTFEWAPDTGFDCTSEDCNNPIFSGITEATIYTLTVSSSNNCSAEASITVIPKTQCDGSYAMPNAFTPNGDGEDDVFALLDLDNGLRISSFIVFNRWGQKVYDGAGDEAGWNGMHHGKLLPMEVYVYMVELVCPDGTEKRVLRGEVTLLR